MDKQYGRIVIVLVVAINLIIAVNGFLHSPFVGYDSDAHLDRVTFGPFHLPTDHSGEYYSPPLPYFLPALVYQLCDSDTIACKQVAGKFAQGMNLLFSIVITILSIKTAELIKPQNQPFKIATLILFGLLTVFYKSFSQFRGEPYLAFFAVLSTYLVLKFSRNPETLTPKDGLFLGICLGGLGLSRQWGFFIFPAIACLIPLMLRQDRNTGFKFGMTILLSFVIAFLSCGWFYFHLYRTYGSFTPFNVDGQKFSFSNQPLSFYRNTGLGNLLLFRTPTRPTFDNQFLPVFYSEIWGDYWGYFTFVRNIPPLNYISNQNEINAYLGRVNLVSLVPTLILAFGTVLGMGFVTPTLRRKPLDFESLALGFLSLIVFISLIGYLYFLIKYPLPPKGATIKATYMIHIFMVLPLLGANLLEKVRAKTRRGYLFCLTLLVGIFIHNVPAMITRYWQ